MICMSWLMVLVLALLLLALVGGVIILAYSLRRAAFNHKLRYLHRTRLEGAQAIDQAIAAYRQATITTLEQRRASHVQARD